MKTRLLFALKYFFFAFAAFTVPKMIVDSGRLVAPLEPSNAPSNAPSPPRSFWPFRFLPTSGSAPASSATPQTSSIPSGAENAFYSDVDASTPSNFNSRDGFNGSSPAPNADALGAAPGRNSAFGFSDASVNGVAVPSASRFARSYPSSRGDAISDARRFDVAPSDDRASFARFAESRLAPSPASTSFAADATPSFFAGSSSATAFPRTFEELFRFGHSPAWLVENWPRVDAVATEDGLVGYRVAISTGDGDDDLVGVFACYFDATSERRVEFSGQTGDYRRILSFLQREYGVALSPRSTADRFVYESTLSNGRGGAVPGRLLVRPNRVFLRGAEKSFFEVDVVLEQPYNRYN